MLDVERLLNGLGVQYRFSIGGKGPQVRMTCPVCKGFEKLWIGVRNERTICFRCRWVPRNSKDLVRTLTGCNAFQGELLVRKYRRIDEGDDTGGSSFAERVNGRLAMLQSRHPSLSATGEPLEYNEQDSPELVLPNNFFILGHRLIPTVTHYALSRGYSMGRMRRYGFGGCVLGRYSGCLILPTYNAGKLVFWQARDALGRGDKFPKYRSPVGHSPAIGLFNLDEAVAYPEIVLCEGVFSSMRVGEDAVATFGNKVSLRQTELLLERGVRNIVLCFDPDTWSIPQAVIERGGTAQPPIIDAFQRVSQAFEGVRVVRLTTKDPDDLGEEAMRHLVANAPVVSTDVELSRLMVS